MNFKRLAAAFLTFSAPFVAAAQAPAAEAKPAQTAPAPAPAPAPEPAKAEPKKDEGFKITPYGFVHTAMLFSSETFAVKDFSAQVSKTNSGGSFNVSARQSRFGLRIGGKDTVLTQADLAGVIEADFYGGIPVNTASSAYHAGPLRLRLATVTASWKTSYGTWALLAGQDYGLVNPLVADSVAYAANQPFTQSGNFTRRSPQFRATYAGAFDIVGVTVIAAVLSPADFTRDDAATPTDPNPFEADFGAGNRSRQPDVEARVALSVKPTKAVNATIGVAGHTNERRYVIDDTTAANAGAKEDIRVNALGADLEVNVPYLTVKAEYTTLDGLDDTYAGLVGQPITGAVGAIARVSTYGVWGQAVVKPLPVLWLTAGYGVEKVKDKDEALIGDGDRVENRSLQLGLIANAGKNLRFGVEWAKTWSKYGDGVEKDAMQTIVATQLKF